MASNGLHSVAPSSWGLPGLAWNWILPLILLLYFVWNKYRYRLNNIPGPYLAAFTNLWRLQNVWSGQAHRTAIELHQQLGPLVRIGPNAVSVGDPKEISTIYGVNPRYKKTAFYPSQSISYFKKPQMNLFSTRDEKYHDEQRKKIANTYSRTTVLGMEPAIDSCVNLLISRVGEFADARQPINLGEWLEYYAFDVIGEVTFSKKMGFLDQGKDVDGMIAGIERMLKYSSRVGQVPEMHRFLLGNPLFPILVPAMESWNQVVVFTLKAMNSRASIARDEELDVYQVEDLGKDMLSTWSNVKKNDPNKMSTRDIIVHTSTNVFAGSGTTSITLRGMIYFLCHNPDKMTKLVHSIDEADRAGLLSNPISYKESNEYLKYVEAVMKETMRLHPGIGLPLERTVPKEGVELCGRHIPGGTIVGVNAWVLHHDAKIFPDPESFIPERWIESSPEEKATMEKSIFTFGAGPRTCLGRHIAFIEIQKAIPELLRHFEVSLTYPEKPWFVQDVFMVQQKGVICNLKRRCKEMKVAQFD